MSLQTITLDLADLERELETFGRKAPQMMARALNRGATSGQTAMTRAIVADTGLQSKFVKREIRVDKASKARPIAGVETSGARIPLIAFGARGPEPSRGRGRGVSYKLRGSRGRIPSAFITRVGAHRGVFTRRGGPGSPRLPIQEKRGPSIPHVFEKFLPTFRSVAEAAVVKTLRQDITFARSRADRV